MSGIPYDIVMRPPPFGLDFDKDPVPGKKIKLPTPIMFMQWEMNHQYILEGLCSAIMMLLASWGIVLLDKLQKCWDEEEGMPEKLGVANKTKSFWHWFNRSNLLMTFGFLLMIGASTILSLFFCTKWPVYAKDAFLMTSPNYLGNWPQ